jgi:hypothetical protein
LHVPENKMFKKGFRLRKADVGVQFKKLQIEEILELHKSSVYVDKEKEGHRHNSVDQRVKRCMKVIAFVRRVSE